MKKSSVDNIQMRQCDVMEKTDMDASDGNAVVAVR